MENRCSFGIILNSNCISRRKNEQIDIDDLSLMEVELIKSRSAITNFSEVTGICQHHKNQYVRDYSSKLHSVKFYLVKRFGVTVLKLYLRVRIQIRMMTLKKL